MPQGQRSGVGPTGTIPLDRQWGGYALREIVRDVLRSDRLLSEPASEGRPYRVLAVRREQRVEAINVADPDLGPSMRELGQVLQGERPELQQMLPLQIAFCALARNGGDVLRAVFGQRRLRVRLEQPLMDGFEAAGDDPDPIAIEKQRAGDAHRIAPHPRRGPGL